MKSTNLEQFVNEHGAERTATLWGVSRQAVEKAVKVGRDIQVIELKNVIEFHESKLLQRVRLKK